MKRANKGYDMALTTMNVLLVSVLLLGACKKKKDDQPTPVNATYDISSSADGKQASSDSKGTAMVTGTYSQSSKKLTYQVVFTGIEPASIDIHEGKPASIGNKLISLAKNSSNKYTSPVAGEITLTADQEKVFLRSPVTHTLYINVVTTRIAKGEIRGKLLLKRRP
jgi:hypothetical protein